MLFRSASFRTDANPNSAGLSGPATCPSCAPGDWQRPSSRWRACACRLLPEGECWGSLTTGCSIGIHCLSAPTCNWPGWSELARKSRSCQERRWEPWRGKSNNESGYTLRLAGGVPEWLKGADCKSVGLRLRWFESSLLHQQLRQLIPAAIEQSRGLHIRFRAGVAQLVELLPSKQNVASSSLVSRSSIFAVKGDSVVVAGALRRAVLSGVCSNVDRPVSIAHVAQW